MPPRVPSLDEVRSQVALAWKTEKARPLAQKAAEQLAEQLKKQGSPPKDATFQGYPVVTIPAIARKCPTQNLIANPYRDERARGDADLGGRLAGRGVPQGLFSLQPGSVAVAANQPKTSYYVMMLDRREPATFAALYVAGRRRVPLQVVRRGRRTASCWRTGWAGCGDRPASTPTGSRPTRPRRRMRPNNRG